MLPTYMPVGMRAVNQKKNIFFLVLSSFYNCMRLLWCMQSLHDYCFDSGSESLLLNRFESVAESAWTISCFALLACVNWIGRFLDLGLFLCLQCACVMLSGF